MANPAVSKVAHVPAHGVHPGVLVLDLTWTTYAQNTDVLDLTSLNVPGTLVQPDSVVACSGVSANGHSVVFVPAGTPAVNNVGKVRLFNGTTEAAAGALAVTARVILTLVKKAAN